MSIDYSIECAIDEPITKEVITSILLKTIALGDVTYSGYWRSPVKGLPMPEIANLVYEDLIAGHISSLCLGIVPPDRGESSTAVSLSWHVIKEGSFELGFTPPDEGSLPPKGEEYGMDYSWYVNSILSITHPYKISYLVADIIIGEPREVFLDKWQVSAENSRFFWPKYDINKFTLYEHLQEVIQEVIENGRKIGCLFEKYEFDMSNLERREFALKGTYQGKKLKVSFEADYSDRIMMKCADNPDECWTNRIYIYAEDKDEREKGDLRPYIKLLLDLFPDDFRLHNFICDNGKNPRTYSR